MILQDINNKTSFHTKIKNIFFLGERENRNRNVNIAHNRKRKT